MLRNNLLPHLDEKQMNNFDFLNGIFETYHVMDTIFFASMEISKKLVTNRRASA